MEKIPKIVLAAALNLTPGYMGKSGDKMKENLGGGVMEQLKGLGDDYKQALKHFESAREKLERWKSEAEEFAKKQTGQKEK